MGKMIFGRVALVLVGAMGLAAQGCGGQSACETLYQDSQAKYKECGITTSLSGGASSGSSNSCTDAQAKLADCFDACLPKIDCPCTKDPTGANCATALKPYSDCITACSA